ncbi:activated RNA polymerase II transcriptional coactivator p15 isoform X2 [Amia ocellicauda]|uniref:activated RNA polymerase II transcriptional coactivator p15 isoform X2 n=1 Tax=Amia ocellicauda TaxID=2972642 RepID=UPI003464B20B
MPKSSEDSVSNSDSQSDAEEDNKAKNKKPPAEKPSPAQKKQKTGEGSSRPVPDKEPPKKKAGAGGGNQDGEEENMIQIGKMRYVRVSLFKRRTFIDIREFYTDSSGSTKPGRKGISLTTEEWSQLKEIVPEIDAAIRKL